jgi:hypothetical protein
MFLESVCRSLQSRLSCDLRHIVGIPKNVKAEGDDVGGRIFIVTMRLSAIVRAAAIYVINASSVESFRSKGALFPRGRRSTRPRNAEENSSR